MSSAHHGLLTGISRALVLTGLISLSSSLGLAQQIVASFIEEVIAAPVPSRQGIVDRFLERHPSAPLYESDTLAVFIYSGPAVSVSVAGDANGWRPGSDTMSNIPGTRFWYRIDAFEEDARLDYKLVIDGSSWILDPRNGHTSRGGFGENSELRMPGYPDQPELLHRNGLPRGTTYDTVYTDAVLGNSRRIIVYVPARRGPEADSLGLLVVHDGLEFVELVDMPTVLDNLIADGAIPPVLAVFVPPVERTPEYSGDKMEPFASFIVNTVIERVRREHPIRDDPSHHVVMGASNGGNISLYMGMTYPQLFGNVAAFSSNVVPAVMEGYAGAERLPVRVYLDIGTYDIPQLLPRVRGLRDTLERHGYPIRYAEHHDGHSWANWRAHIDDALRFLLATP